MMVYYDGYILDLSRASRFAKQGVSSIVHFVSGDELVLVNYSESFKLFL